MFIFINEILQLPPEFLSSQLGIIIQIAAIITIMFSGAKYLNKKLDERINRNIESNIEPIVVDLCKQISDVGEAIKTYKLESNSSQKAFASKTDTAIKYIDRAIMNLQGIKEDKIMRMERGDEE